MISPITSPLQLDVPHRPEKKTASGAGRAMYRYGVWPLPSRRSSGPLVFFLGKKIRWDMSIQWDMITMVYPIIHWYIPSLIWYYNYYPIIIHSRCQPQDVSIHALASILPSGKRLHNYGKSPCFMGKFTISMAMFNSYVKLPEGMSIQWDMITMVYEYWDMDNDYDYNGIIPKSSLEIRTKSWSSINWMIWGTPMTLETSK